MLIDVPGMVEEFLVWFVTKLSELFIQLIHSWFENQTIL